MGLRIGRAVAVAVCATLLSGASALGAGNAPTHQTMSLDEQGTSPMDSPSLIACVGYTGRIFEDRHGSIKLTAFTSGPNAGRAHAVGSVEALIRFFPKPGQPGSVYTGTYREQDEGWLHLSDFSPAGNTMYNLVGTATSASGNTIHFRVFGHTFVDRKTGEVRRDIEGSSCH
jgi:hypothetical protein